MQTKTIQHSFTAVTCALLLLQASALSWAGNASLSNADSAALKSETFTQPKTEEISVPLQISPVQIEAPPRRIDLPPERANKINLQTFVYPLSGLPADLSEYPILDFRTSDIGSGFWGVDLALDTHAKGVSDTLVHVGDPTLFPDMIDTNIDFRSAEFAPSGMVYAIKRKVGLDGDEKWRYTPNNIVLKGIANGTISASFAPGGHLVLAKAFGSLDIEKSPWLNFEYILSKGALWSVQINAKVNTEGLKRYVTLYSKPFKGEGKQKLLLNLQDLLHEAAPLSKVGHLEDLIIHFMLDETAAPVEDARIQLGRLEFYRVQKPAQGLLPARLLVVQDIFNPINLADALKKQLIPIGDSTFEVLRGSLVSSAAMSTASSPLPKITLQSNYREKIPKLFVGEAFYLNVLNGKELAAVLDQRLFLEKQILWKSGQRDSKRSSFPLMSYMLDLAIEDSAFIETDYTCSSAGGPLPLLTLAGTDQRGQPVEVDHLLLKGQPIKVRGMHLRKITLAFRHEHGALLPGPCSVKNIQISSFKKSSIYHPKATDAYITLGDIAAAPNPIWRANREHFVVDAQEGESVWTVRAFSMQEKIIGDAVVVFDLDTPRDASLSYFLRLRGINGSGYFEKLFPMGKRGELPVSNLTLHGLDIVVKNDGDHAVAPANISLNQLELRHGRGLGQPDLSEMHQLDASLSYSQILEGGKRAILPKRFIDRGEHRLIQVANEDIDITIDPSFSRFTNDQKTVISVGAASSKSHKIGFILAGGLVLLFGMKLKSRWMPFVNRSWRWGFWSILIVLLTVASYMIFASNNADAFAWGSLLLVAAYGHVVRCKARPSLMQKWDFFSTHYSAPYFILALSLLLICILELMLKQQAAAERIAVILYYLLVTGTVIEFIRFSKEAPAAVDT